VKLPVARTPQSGGASQRLSEQVAKSIGAASRRGPKGAIILVAAISRSSSLELQEGLVSTDRRIYGRPKERFSWRLLRVGIWLFPVGALVCLAAVIVSLGHQQRMSL
jgi:hypothetical protein